jgi:hypothetical protein
MSAWLEHVTLAEDNVQCQCQISFSSRTDAGTSLMTPELRFESLECILWAFESMNISVSLLGGGPFIRINNF